MIYKVEDGYDVYAVKNASKILDIPMNSINNAYLVTLKFPSASCYSRRAVGVIDSGASNTVISMNALFKNISDSQYNIIKDAALCPILCTRRVSKNLRRCVILLPQL